MKKDQKSRLQELRFFVLADSCLLYFRKFTDEVAAGRISITSKAFRVVPCSRKNRPFMLAISENGDRDTRVFRLDCMSAKSQNDWLAALQGVASSKTDAQMVTGSLIEDSILKVCAVACLLVRVFCFHVRFCASLMGLVCDHGRRLRQCVSPQLTLSTRPRAPKRRRRLNATCCAML